MKIAMTTSAELTHYCIIRGDLSHGMACAQLIHAAGESSPGDLPPTTIAVALCARDEAHLLEVERELTAKGATFTSVRETDGDHAGQLMAIGLRPGPRAEVHRLVSRLPRVR